MTGKKRFVDATLHLSPALFAGPAAPQVQYCVQGQRADVSGPISNGLSVQLGQATAGIALFTHPESSKVQPAKRHFAPLRP